MFLPKILLVAGILLDPTFIEKSAGQAPICTSSQIGQQGGLTGCTCRSFSGTGQCANRCPADPAGCGQQSPAGFYLKDCSADCTSDDNKDCEACGVWLSLVCQCLQTGSCPQSKPSGSFWVQLGRALVTTNVAIDNIVTLQKSHAGLAPFGWEFGQAQQSDPNTQGLAINPIHTITQDQIHMHICQKNTEMSKFLATPPGGISSYSSLAPISLPGTFQRDKQQTTMWCQASQAPNTRISGDDVSAAINKVLLGMFGSVCNYNVAAAVIRDDNGYTWACVTADRDDTEHRFLVNCPS